MLSHLEEFRSFLQFSFHFDFWRSLKACVWTCSPPQSTVVSLDVGGCVPRGKQGEMIRLIVHAGGVVGVLALLPCPHGGGTGSTGQGSSRRSRCWASPGRARCKWVFSVCLQRGRPYRVNRVKGCSCVPSAGSWARRPCLHLS